MFGVLKGASCAMEPGQRLQWRGHICGVCLALDKHYGLVSRIATNYDAALLSVMYDAQMPQSQAQRPSYCPLRNSFKAEVVAAGSPGVDYAASMALMMASSRIRDHVLDNDSRSRLVRGAAMGMSKRWMRAAQGAIASMGLDAKPIEEQIRRQPEVEARPGEGFSFYARPTELAVGAAFGHTATLAMRPQNADLLHEMGRMFGRIMVLLDSYQDYADDLKAQGFNALESAFGEEEWKRQASRIFHQAYRTLRTCFDQLDLPQSALLRALLIGQLQKRGHRTLQICHQMSAECRPLGVKSAVALSPHRLRSSHEPGGGERRGPQVEREDEPEDRSREQSSRDLECCFGVHWCYCGDADCCDGDCCDCGDGDCCDCGDGGCCDCGDCDCGDCDCGDCDCGGCDC